MLLLPWGPQHWVHMPSPELWPHGCLKPRAESVEEKTHRHIKSQHNNTDVYKDHIVKLIIIMYLLKLLNHHSLQ